MKKVIIAVALLALAMTSTAQSKAFKLGQWTEIQNSIIKELNRSYVDTLPIDRMKKASIDKMLSVLDPYTIYVPEESNEDFQLMINNSYGGIGAIIYKPETNGYVIINEPYEGSPAVRGGLQCGDEIMEVDGVSTIGLTTKESSDRMKGEPGTEVVFLVKKVRTGEEKKISIIREKIHIPEITFSGMLDNVTGYIQLTGFTEGVAAEVRKEVSRLKSEGMQRLFIDLRGNGGGHLSEAVDIVGIFVPKGTLVVSAKGRGNSETHNHYTESEPLDTELPLVILVDSSSASASEIVAGALQDLDRATIMGDRTFGKGLVQGISPLPYGGQLKLTTAKYYIPSGRCVQAIDYSNRREDGSVGHIPDSLTHEFRTLKGRIVRDGGGITPDIKLDSVKYSRLTYSLVLNGIIEQYTLNYVKAHESIPALKDFHFDDYDSFVEFARNKDFDYRSSARAYCDIIRKELREDGMLDSNKEILDSLEKSLDISKEDFLYLKKDEIIPFIEEEIAVRYYFQRAGVEVRLRYDKQLKQALSL